MGIVSIQRFEFRDRGIFFSTHTKTTKVNAFGFTFFEINKNLGKTENFSFIFRVFTVGITTGILEYATSSFFPYSAPIGIGIGVIELAGIDFIHRSRISKINPHEITQIKICGVDTIKFRRLFNFSKI